MREMTLAPTRGFEKHKRATRKAEFLGRVESLMPLEEFRALIEPVSGGEGVLDPVAGQ